ncbi:MAG: ATP-binding protein [Armatimonadetes bacterium]|nr:ATP-binding protein [Armatimonadota bacterium]
MRFELGEMKTDWESFGTLARLHHEISNSREAERTVDLSRTASFQANLCAALAAVVAQQATAVSWTRPRRNVACAWQVSGFWEWLGRRRRIDLPPPPIPFDAFWPTQRNEQHDYVRRSFGPSTPGLPQMTPALLEEFRSALLELLSNADDHAEATDGVFCCGEYSPSRHRLRYTVADTGIGIRQRVQRSRSQSKTPVEAIRWALAGNTTRSGSRPGGNGLQLIQEFIGLNSGKLVLASDAAVCTVKHGVAYEHPLGFPFPGTAVTLEINTNDQQSYRLATEIDPGSVWGQ